MSKRKNNVLRIYVGDNQIFEKIQGKFAEPMSYVNGDLYLIGGAARAIVFGGDFANRINDYDFTVIGEMTRVKYHRHNSIGSGDHRVEIDDSAGHNATKNEYFSTRDLTINQVLVDRYGYAYVTKQALADNKARIIRYAGTGIPNDREVVRAFRFAYEANFSVEEKFVELANKIKRPDMVFYRYRSQGTVPYMDWDEFINYVKEGGHRYD